MWKKTLEHYKVKFNDAKESINIDNIDSKIKMKGITDVKSELLANSDNFRSLALEIADIMPGKVSCTSYAAAVAVIAEKCGIDYKVYGGFCIPNNYGRYEDDLLAFKKGKDAGKKHPFFATHVFVMINDKYYEYINGVFEGVDHLDYEEI